ncbi:MULTISPECIES: dihydroxyacetone kinase subunit L [unclassified Rhizobium]|uniref:dihydroxyacetone kinase subunit L n=1 Tax=Rhizobium sp. 16-488-2a TaxID=2819990 RepID=UPI001ADB03F4|nr:dihydroxyacetone kinase subunit L [Rhizobium sp. 16-488-2a]MBO9178287.1 dihydroxyacetone kinase subunit L [Rhizobium sp. 16-488-2a]
MMVDKSKLTACVDAFHRAMRDLEQVLNAADAKLGDGDTGTMLARLFAGLSQTDLSQASDISAAFNALARAAATSTGSSLGTLVATALLTFGKETKGHVAIEASAMPKLLDKAMEAMMARGKAEIGDKTILDSVDAIARRLAETPDLQTAADASEAALDEFRSKPNRIGRARMFGDQTIGVDDPGMLAVARLTRSLADELKSGD